MVSHTCLSGCVNRNETCQNQISHMYGSLSNGHVWRIMRFVYGADRTS